MGPAEKLAGGDAHQPGRATCLRHLPAVRSQGTVDVTLSRHAIVLLATRANNRAGNRAVRVRSCVPNVSRAISPDAKIYILHALINCRKKKKALREISFVRGIISCMRIWLAWERRERYYRNRAQVNVKTPQNTAASTQKLTAIRYYICIYIYLASVLNHSIQWDLSEYAQYHSFDISFFYTCPTNCYYGNLWCNIY